MSDYLMHLYRKRAEMAEMESQCEDYKKYCWHGGFWWRLFDWFQRSFSKDREAINLEIAELKGQDDE